MTLQEFRRIQKLLQAAEEEALADGVNITLPEFQVVYEQLKLKVLEDAGFTLGEYEQVKEESRQKREDERKNINLMGAADADRIKEEIGQFNKGINTALGLLKNNTDAEVQDLKSKILEQAEDLTFRITEINWETLRGKPEILDRNYVANEISRAVSRIKIPEMPKLYNDSDIKDKLKELSGAIKGIKFPKIPKVPDYKKLKKELEDYSADHISKKIDILGMPDWRKSVMGLQGQIDEKVKGVNTKKITISATEPSNPKLYDLWVDIS